MPATAERPDVDPAEEALNDNGADGSEGKEGGAETTRKTFEDRGAERARKLAEGARAIGKKIGPRLDRIGKFLGRNINIGLGAVEAGAVAAYKPLKAMGEGIGYVLGGKASDDLENYLYEKGAPARAWVAEKAEPLVRFGESIKRIGEAAKSAFDLSSAENKAHAALRALGKRREKGGDPAALATETQEALNSVVELRKVLEAREAAIKAKLNALDAIKAASEAAPTEAAA